MLPLGCVRKRFSGCSGFYGFSGEGAAQNHMEAPQNFDTAFPLIVISSEVEKSSLHTGQTKDVGER